jgi:hypothetical protein
MLPVVGQVSQEPEVAEPGAVRSEADSCTDDCCAGAETLETSAAPTTREANRALEL